MGQRMGESVARNEEIDKVFPRNYLYKCEAIRLVSLSSFPFRYSNMHVVKMLSGAFSNCLKSFLIEYQSISTHSELNCLI